MTPLTYCLIPIICILLVCFFALYWSNKVYYWKKTAKRWEHRAKVLSLYSGMAGPGYDAIGIGRPETWEK